MKVNDYQNRVILALARYLPEVMSVQAGMDVIQAYKADTAVLILSGIEDGAKDQCNCQFELQVNFDQSSDVRYINAIVSRVTAFVAHTLSSLPYIGDKDDERPCLPDDPVNSGPCYIGLPSWNVQTRLQGFDPHTNRIMFVTHWWVRGLELEFDFERRDPPHGFDRLVTLINEGTWDLEVESVRD